MIYKGKNTGKEFEDQVIILLKQRNINFTQEKTLTNGKVRRKDKCVDIVLDDIGYKLELKTTTEKQGLDYSLYDDGKKHKIKFHQICNMTHLILEFRPNEARVLSKIEFLKLVMNHKKNSITYKDIKNIGKPLLEWLEGLSNDESV